MNDSLAPRQARSRESTRKLLRAATEVLGQHGLDGATIPRIAEHAGLTPGAIYRRFPDKETLLETVILGMLERQDERLRLALTPQMAREIPLRVFAEQTITNMLLAYRANAAMLRAMRQFVQTRTGTPFHKKAVAIEMRTFKYLADLFMERRAEIRHPNAQTAVSLALVMQFSTIAELIIADDNMKSWRAVLPTDDATLKREMLRAFLSYLGADSEMEGL